MAGTTLTLLVGSIRGTLFFFFVAFVLRALLRRTWLVGIVFVLLFSLPSILGSDYLALEAPTQLAVYTVAFVAVARFGLVTLAAGMLTTNLLMTVPMPGSLSELVRRRGRVRVRRHPGARRLGLLHFARGPAAVEGRAVRVARLAGAWPIRAPCTDPRCT